MAKQRILLDLPCRNFYNAGMTPKAIHTALLGIILIALGFICLSADDDLAKAFISKGDEAMKKSEPARALEFYQKALRESPEMPEIHFKLGEAYLKSGEKIKSRKSFNKCISLIDRIEKPTGPQKDLRKRAQQSLDALDASRKEGKQIEQEYIKELLNFARKAVKKDNLLAKDALESILLLDPENAEAKKLLEETLKNTIIPRWKSLFANTLDGWSPQDPASWRVEKDQNLFCETRKALTNFKMKEQFEGDFKVCADFKIVEGFPSNSGPYTAGVMLGREEGNDDGMEYSIAVMDESELKLVKFNIGKNAQTVASCKLPENYKKSDWNKLLIEVKDMKLTVSLNDKMALEYTMKDKHEFKGAVGLWVQYCHAGFTNIKYIK
ncbi:MAG: DUF1080 domain-containing protein [Planctomycetes bacterium]|nr:DUF1080 domain-containing protein [Planctomycetota bacterium]